MASALGIKTISKEEDYEEIVKAATVDRSVR